MLYLEPFKKKSQLRVSVVVDGCCGSTAFSLFKKKIICFSPIHARVVSDSGAEFISTLCVSKHRRRRAGRGVVDRTKRIGQRGGRGGIEHDNDTVIF